MSRLKNSTIMSRYTNDIIDDPETSEIENEKAMIAYNCTKQKDIWCLDSGCERTYDPA